jgi:glyoxalase/bleomycin resistance protein/dioxygenase superfamily protein
MSEAFSTTGRFTASRPHLNVPHIGVRPYIELDVSSLDRSVDFYSVLMNSRPTWHDRTAARFNLVDPPLTLLLNEEPGAVGRDGHLGVQLKYITDIAAARERLEANKIAVDLEEANTSCCFSVANKVWVSDPDKNLWELYVLLEENTSEVRCGSSCACESSGCG